MNPVGVFDSGIGGVSVLRSIRAEMPSANLIYVGDNIHLPYGEKSMEEIRTYTRGVVQFLIDSGCSVVVIACNTASAAALKEMREQFPNITFVGMEPAVKPAAEQTQTGVVGVIATTATFQGELFASVVERFANNVKVLRQPCPGLVQQIEAGELATDKTKSMLHEWLDPMKEQNIDRLVLGCTHYPFVAETIRGILGDGVQIIDPAPAIARQVKRVSDYDNLKANGAGEVRFYTSGNPEQFSKVLKQLTGWNEVIQQLHWNNNHLTR